MEKSNKLKIPLLIIALLVVFGGGSFAIWSITRKEEDEETESQIDGTPVGGRLDATNFYTAEELNNNQLFDKKSPDLTPEYKAVLVSSTQGKQLVKDRAKKIQLSKVSSDLVRAKHDVGRTLVNNSAFSASANKEIAKMFGLIDGTTAGQWLTYPVYGQYETEAAPLRADIENFLAKDGQGYNLTNKRHSGNRWWFGSVGLNLMYGNSDSHLHTADNIWWGKLDRDGVDFFKKVNGHDTTDKHLVDKKKNGQGVFAAWGIYTLVKNWKAEMDYFDEVTRQEAIEVLEKEGMIRLL